MTIKYFLPCHLFAAIIFILPGCRPSLPTVSPIPFEQYSFKKDSDTLIVLLPGLGDRATTFKERGFIDFSPKDVDLITVDAHFGYYQNATIFDRLHHDIILPALAQGYQSIWLLGVSLGGMGAVNYVGHHPNIIDGLILFAPYPGEGEVLNEIINAGGLKQWNEHTDDHEALHWKTLKHAIIECHIPILIGVGQDDRVLKYNQLLIDHLPPGASFIENGGHKWKTWNNLWEKMNTAVNLKEPQSVTRCLSPTA